MYSSASPACRVRAAQTCRDGRRDSGRTMREATPAAVSAASFGPGLDRCRQATASCSTRPVLRHKAPEPSQPHNDQKERQVMQTKPSTKGQRRRQTQQTSQNTYQQTVNDTGLPGSASDAEGRDQRQQHLKPRRQLGADPRGEVIDGILVRRASSLKSQDKRVDDNYNHQDDETQRYHCQRSAEDAKPSDTR